MIRDLLRFRPEIPAGAWRRDQGMGLGKIDVIDRGAILGQPNGRGKRAVRSLGKRESEVFAAVSAGAQTAAEVAEKIGIERSHASAYLSTLAGYRLISKVGIRRVGMGRPVNLYAARRAVE